MLRGNTLKKAIITILLIFAVLSQSTLVSATVYNKVHFLVLEGFKLFTSEDIVNAGNYIGIQHTGLYLDNLDDETGDSMVSPRIQLDTAYNPNSLYAIQPWPNATEKVGEDYRLVWNWRELREGPYDYGSKHIHLQLFETSTGTINFNARRTVTPSEITSQYTTVDLTVRVRIVEDIERLVVRVRPSPGVALGEQAIPSPTFSRPDDVLWEAFFVNAGTEFTFTVPIEIDNPYYPTSIHYKPGICVYANKHYISTYRSAIGGRVSFENPRWGSFTFSAIGTYEWIYSTETTESFVYFEPLLRIDPCSVAEARVKGYLDLYKAWANPDWQIVWGMLAYIGISIGKELIGDILSVILQDPLLEFLAEEIIDVCIDADAWLKEQTNKAFVLGEDWKRFHGPYGFLGMESVRRNIDPRVLQSKLKEIYNTNAYDPYKFALDQGFNTFLALDYANFPDFVGTELGYMAFLTGKEEDAWKASDSTMAQSYQWKQIKFIEHLEWMKKLENNGQTLFYQALGTSTAGMVDSDIKYLNGLSIDPMLAVTTLSPVDVLVTDPSGFRVGYDPETDQVINEILKASYSGRGAEPQLIVIPNPLAGDYEILLFGTATGYYTVTIEMMTLEGFISETFTGETIEGTTDYYSASLSETGEMEVISWDCIFEDTQRGTVLKISTDDSYFKFTATEKEFSIKQALKMRVCKHSIFIYHKDDEINLVTIAIDMRINFCFAYAEDMQTGARYLLVDKPGIE